MVPAGSRDRLRASFEQSLVQKIQVAVNILFDILPVIMRRSILLRGLLCAALLLSATGMAAPADDKEPAPHFHAVTTTGERYTNDSVKGKVVLLEFWTTWCPHCADDAPIVDRLGKEFESKGLVLLAINVGESRKTVKKYLEAHPRACRIVMMEDTNLAAMYQANAYPIYVVIDREGTIVDTVRGSVGERGLRRMLAGAGIASHDDDDS